MDPRLERHQRRALLFFSGEILLFVFFLAAMAGGGHLPCLFRLTTGFYCGGCGLSRSAYALFHGDWQTSLRQNIMIVPFTLFMIYINLSRLHLFFRGRDLPMPRSPWILVPLILLVAAYTILRNLPFEPFTYLAPF